MLVFFRDECLERDFRNLVETRFHIGLDFNLVLIHHQVKIAASEYFDYLHELVLIVRALEKGVFLKYDGCHQHSCAPDVQGVPVVDVVHQELRSLVVPRGHKNAVVLLRVIVLSQSPVNQLECLILFVHDDVLRLHVPVHDALGVAKV